MITRVALGSLAIALLIGADEPAKDVKREMELLQGEWKQEYSENQGKRHVPRTELTLTVKGDQWITKHKGAILITKGDSIVQTKDGTESTAMLKIDPSKEPKTIDLLRKIEGKEQISLFIYKLDGDTLTMCKTIDGKERPKEFKSTQEEGMIAVWKRVKK